MPISEDEWESGKQWNDVERAVAEFLDAVEPRAYAIPELHDLIVDGGTTVPPDTWDDEVEEANGVEGTNEVDVAPMDVTERQVRAAVTDLRDADYLESKRIQTADGVVTHYRRGEHAFLG